VNRFLATTLISCGLFALMLFTGFHAKFAGLVAAKQDAVVVAYIQHAFGAGAFAFVSVALIAAGMSTLDGILVALSATVVNDLYLPLRGEKAGSGLALSRVVLVCVGLFSLALAWNPPRLVGLFAQQGVYGMAAASFVPVLFGVLYRERMPAALAAAAAVFGLAAHLVMNLGLGIANPAVSATWAILASAGLARLMLPAAAASPGVEAGREAYSS
jgi:SSS family solute:Na+ symporter/sodium/pantothenate symporter